MPNYVLTYHGKAEPMSDDPTVVEAVMAEWGQWYGALGESLVDGGAPLGESTAIGADGSAAENPASLTGYTIVTAADMAGASALAQGCPVLKNGHTVQISQAIDMN